jgi:hypothetical protein
MAAWLENALKHTAVKTIGLKLMTLSVLIGSPVSVNANPAVPKEIQDAFEAVHNQAKSSNVRNLFMLNYTYFAKGFCKDQDCSQAKIKTEIDFAKSKMGDDFLIYSQKETDYSAAIQNLQKSLSKGDLASLSGLRTFRQIYDHGIFATCVDFAKAVLGMSIENGFPESQLRMYVTMADDAYRKMCPSADGRQPIFPRPVVHTLVAYFDQNQWFALNVEDPSAVAIPLGSNLPTRLARSHQFTFPPLIAYQKLAYAGSYEPRHFIDGYPFEWLQSITAAGTLDVNTSALLCQ